MEKTLDTSHCFNLAMRKSSRLITQFYEGRLSEVGLKSGQFSILRAIRALKETTNKDLQKVLVLDQTTLSRNLKPLIREEYLQLSANPDDARVKHISLTKKGKALYKKALPIWEKAQQDIVDKMGERDAKKILSQADSFVEMLG